MEWLTNLNNAFEYGYSSTTSFNSAFQSVHGITPTVAKNTGSILNAYPPIKFSVEVTEGNDMSYHIEQKEAMRIVGIRKPLVEDMEKNRRNVPEFWSQTLEGSEFLQICGLSTLEPKGILGVTIYQNPQNIFYYIVATNSYVPMGMYEYEIPAAT